MAIISTTFNIDDSTFLIGHVVKVDTVSREVAAYIPKLMSGIPNDGLSIKIPTNSNGNFENLEYSDMINKSNYIWIEPHDMVYKLPKEGSKVEIVFVDNYIGKPLWKPFNMLGDYEPIEEEKYRKLFNINTSGNMLDIYENDIFGLEFEGAIVSREVKDKNKLIRIRYTNDYHIGDIPDTSKDGTLWFDPDSGKIKIQVNGSYKNILLEDDLDSIYEYMDTLPNVIRYVNDNSLVNNDRIGKIYVVDKNRSSGFFHYEESTIDNILTETEGLYKVVDDNKTYLINVIRETDDNGEVIYLRYNIEDSYIVYDSNGIKLIKKLDVLDLDPGGDQ